MAKNENLHRAKEAKNDEFYTQYEDIQSELNHYGNKFRGKTVLCNCDDPFESNFCKFFLRNFNYLGLRRLICTSYSTSPVVGRQMTLFDRAEEPVTAGYGYVMDISEVPMANGRGVSDDDIDRLLRSFSASYTDGEGLVAINIMSYEGEPAAQVEKTDTQPEVITRYGINFYLIENISSHIMAWYDGKYEYYVSGDVGDDILLEIVDSMFE